MHLKTLILVHALSCLTSVAWAKDDQLSLEEATARALSTNPKVLQALSVIAVRRDEASIARTRRWPTLSTTVLGGQILNYPSLTIPKGSLGNFQSTGPVPDQDTNIGIPRRIGGYAVSQFALPLTERARIGLTIRAADLETGNACEQAEVVRQQVAARVRSLYFEILALELARTVAASQTQVAEEVVRLAQKGLSEGTSLTVEIQAAEARLERARADAANLEDDIHSGHEQLNLLMGAPLDAGIRLSSGLLPPDAPPLEEVEALAAANRPEVRQARLRAEQAGLDVRSKRLERVPEVNLVVVDYGFLNSGNLAPHQLAIAGVSVSWEPWDWGRKGQEIAIAQQRSAQARFGLADAEAQASFEAGRARREWEKAQRDLTAARRETASAAEAMRVSRQRYENQAELFRTVLETQALWEAAGQKEAKALAATGAAWADLQLAIGAQL
jgi:outer membrane protein TolC